MGEAGRREQAALFGADVRDQLSSGGGASSPHHHLVQGQHPAAQH